MQTLHLQILGRVQGVGFRESMRVEAERLGVTGWVSNRADGSVEAMIQGPSVAVSALLDWVKIGPSMARVDRVIASESPAHDHFIHFERRAG